MRLDTRATPLLLAVAIIVIMVLWPPYAVMYDPGGLNVHGPIGYHPVWSAPSPDAALEMLSERLRRDSPDTAAVLDSVTAAGFQTGSVRVIMNTVMLTFQIIALALITVVSLWILHRRRKSRFTADRS
jgi:hypothetical protein